MLKWKTLPPDSRFLLFCTMLAIWGSIVWFVPHYDYLPDWFPALDVNTMGLLKCVQPVFLCFTGVLMLFSVVMFFRSTRRSGQNVRGDLQMVRDGQRRKGRIGLGIALIGLALLPWIFGAPIDRALLDYGLRRYDPVVDAIETYQHDARTYPQTIEALIPQYLSAYPKNYMKFARNIAYHPDTNQPFDQRPFTFYIFGLDTGLSTKIIDYCPESVPSCHDLLKSTNAKRINQRWVLEIMPGQ